MIQIDLPLDLETRIQAGAARHGMSLAEYLLDLAERDLAFDEAPPTTPADILNYWDRIGARPVFGDRPDSPELVRQWRDQDEQQRK